ncbi:hypothetical protein [Alteriqipengyuania sp.]|uniref:hypothetical protein n=1 Tax=Alteriqipengyuania sp. TaxID=2800692 RepID=UPI0035117C46
MTSESVETSGEERLKSRRKRFWRYLGIAMVGAILAGLVSGTMTSLAENDFLPRWAALIAVAVVAVGFAYFTRDYFRRIDELDLMDNLWAHLTGLYGGLIVFAVWYFLAQLEYSGEPSAFAIIVAMMLITGASYGLRKLGLR